MMYYYLTHSGVGVSIVLRSMSVLMEATDKNESYSTSLNDYLQVSGYSS